MCVENSRCCEAVKMNKIQSHFYEYFNLFRCDPQKAPYTPGSPEGNTEVPGTAASEPLLPS